MVSNPEAVEDRLRSMRMIVARHGTEQLLTSIGYLNDCFLHGQCELQKAGMAHYEHSNMIISWPNIWLSTRREMLWLNTSGLMPEEM